MFFKMQPAPVQPSGASAMERPSALAASSLWARVHGALAVALRDRRQDSPVLLVRGRDAEAVAELRAAEHVAPRPDRHGLLGHKGVVGGAMEHTVGFAVEALVSVEVARRHIALRLPVVLGEASALHRRHAVGRDAHAHGLDLGDGFRTCP